MKKILVSALAVLFVGAVVTVPVGSVTKVADCYGGVCGESAPRGEWAPPAPEQRTPLNCTKGDNGKGGVCQPSEYQI